MIIKKLTFCILFFTHAINSAEEDNSDNKKISISTVEEDSSITKNNWNTKKWGSIFLLFNPIMHLTAFKPEYSWLTFFRIFTGDILYRYIAKKGVGVMLKLGFNSSFIALDKDTYIRLSPSLTLSFCWVYKKKGNKMFSGSICPIGVGWVSTMEKVQNIEKHTEEYKGGYKEEFKAKNDWKFSKKIYIIPFLTISYLHYENGKGFFLSWGKFDMVYSKVYSKKFLESIVSNIVLSLGHLELGFSLLKSKHKKNIDL